MEGVIVSCNLILCMQAANQSSTLHVRIPFWASLNGSKASLNDEILALPPPGTSVFLFLVKLPIHVLWQQQKYHL